MSDSVIWYESIIKPFFAPPAWIFGPVWTLLYAIISITFIRVFYLAYKRIIPDMVALPFVLNLTFNFSFSFLQFGIQNNYIALADIILVLITLIWAMIAIWQYSRSLAYAQVPYLLWVCFATILQISITVLN